MSRSFLTLPGELRHKVYCYLFKDEEKVSIRWDGEVLSRKFLKSCPRSAQFLLTCKAIRSEALPVLYGSPIFAAASHDELTKFFEAIGIEGRKCIKKLRIEPQENLLRTNYFAEGRPGMNSDRWTELESLQQVTLQCRLLGRRQKCLDFGLDFLRELAKSKPQPGHFFYDYMNSVGPLGVKWCLELYITMHSEVITVPPRSHAGIKIEDAIIAVEVEIAKSKHGSKEEPTWILRGRDEEAIVPLCRKSWDRIKNKWERLAPIRL